MLRAFAVEIFRANEWRLLTTCRIDSSSRQDREAHEADARLTAARQMSDWQRYFVGERLRVAEVS